MTSTDPQAAQRRIADIKNRLADARARIPKHDIPAALMVEIDELEEELARLESAQASQSVPEQIAKVKQRLADARARIPKHDIPAALMAEIDELE
jgi:ABC-type Fe2+-enterobactin transport system substrate-binding protein